MRPPLAIVTTGPASTPIDRVRRITNFSTGEIGLLLSAALVSHGFETLLFRGKHAVCTGDIPGATVREFLSNSDLARLLTTTAAERGGEVREFFHAAALSDYEVSALTNPDGHPIIGHKIPGNLPRLHLTLEPAAKILPNLRQWFPNARITAWKYELDGSKNDALNEARRQITSGFCDASAVNGSAYGSGFGLLTNEKSVLHFDTRRELADFLALRAAKSVNPV